MTEVTLKNELHRKEIFKYNLLLICSSGFFYDNISRYKISRLLLFLVEVSFRYTWVAISALINLSWWQRWGGEQGKGLDQKDYKNNQSLRTFDGEYLWNMGGCIFVNATDCKQAAKAH